MNINKTFKKKRFRRIKKQFNYENTDEVNDNPGNNFRKFYFNVIADGMELYCYLVNNLINFKFITIIPVFYTMLVNSKK